MLFNFFFNKLFHIQNLYFKIAQQLIKKLMVLVDEIKILHTDQTQMKSTHYFNTNPEL